MELTYSIIDFRGTFHVVSSFLLDVVYRLVLLWICDYEPMIPLIWQYDCFVFSPKKEMVKG